MKRVLSFLAALALVGGVLAVPAASAGDLDAGEGSAFADADTQQKETPVKKGCKKNPDKGKKKGCKKAIKKSCAAYEPGEEGAEAETTVVTDKATEDEPIEVTIENGPGAAVSASHTFHNVQVDSAASEAGLYVRYEFAPYEDHDLYVKLADGTEVARAAGFNQTPYGPLDGTGNGGHSEMGAEQIDGLRSPDCQGYTLDLANYLGMGGEYTVKLWLGEIQNDHTEG
jgi:hypothetical protein